MGLISTATPTGGDHLPEERRLLRRYHEDGDVAARDELAERFLPLARRLARRFERSGQSTEDLVQVASIGLLKAIDRYDTERGTTFSTFAVPTILGELKRHLRDQGWALRVPRPVQELALRVASTAQDLGEELGRSPSATEIAAALHVSTEEVLEAQEAALARDTASLDRPLSEEEGAGSHVDTIGDEEAGYELVEDVSAVAPALRALPAREREVLRLRFFEDLTQTDIAERMGVSQMQISRLVRRALDRAREEADSG
jgi:RNA polymerase sigma-B factor